MEEFLTNLVPSNKTATYYFDKLYISEIKQNKHQITELNRLIGVNPDEFNNILRDIIRKNFNIVSLIPLLISCREIELDLLSEFSYDKKWIVETYSFDSKIICGKKISAIIDFFEKVGLKDFFVNSEIDDVYSYMLGSHLGLRASARKNKSGLFMEEYIDRYLAAICYKDKIEYISQANSKKILKHFNIDVKDVIKNRRFDFAINNNGKLILIEVNFYNSTGSKIKSTANEYIKLNSELKNCDYIQDFIWITDGPAWKKEKNILDTSLKNIKNMINIYQMNNGYIQNKLAQ